MREDRHGAAHVAAADPRRPDRDADHHEQPEPDRVAAPQSPELTQRKLVEEAVLCAPQHFTNGIGAR